MLTVREQLIRKSRLLDDRDVEERATRARLIEGQDEVIRDLRSDLHDATTIWPLSPADGLLAQLRRRLAAVTTTGTERDKLSDAILKAQLITIRLFRARLYGRTAKPSTSRMQKRATARDFLGHWAT